MLESGQKRRINREKLDYSLLEEGLADPSSLRAQVFYPYVHMLRQRAAEPAFHPTAGQEIVEIHPALFALWRSSVSEERHVLCLQNVSANTIKANLSLRRFQNPKVQLADLLSGSKFRAKNHQLSLQLPPYGIFWLRVLNCDSEVV